jgi:hypothetical protein
LVFPLTLPHWLTIHAACCGHGQGFYARKPMLSLFYKGVFAAVRKKRKIEGNEMQEE